MHTMYQNILPVFLLSISNQTHLSRDRIWKCSYTCRTDGCTISNPSTNEHCVIIMCYSWNCSDDESVWNAGGSQWLVIRAISEECNFLAPQIPVEWTTIPNWQSQEETAAQDQLSHSWPFQDNQPHFRGKVFFQWTTQRSFCCPVTRGIICQCPLNS